MKDFNVFFKGVCLTVTELLDNRNGFKVGISPETLRKTNLGIDKNDQKFENKLIMFFIRGIKGWRWN